MTFNNILPNLYVFITFFLIFKVIKFPQLSKTQNFRFFWFLRFFHFSTIHQSHNLVFPWNTFSFCLSFLFHYHPFNIGPFKLMAGYLLIFLHCFVQTPVFFLLSRDILFYMKPITLLLFFKINLFFVDL